MTRWAIGAREGQVRGRGGMKAFILNKMTSFMGGKIKRVEPFGS